MQMGLAFLLILFQLFLQNPVASLLPPERDTKPYFSFPMKMEPGTIYRLADHTNFEWDVMEIYCGYYSGLSTRIDEIREEFDPDFFIFRDIPRLLVFLKNEKIVFYMVNGGLKIHNPQAKSVPWKLEFSPDDAVFVSVESELWRYYLIPYTP